MLIVDTGQCKAEGRSPVMGTPRRSGWVSFRRAAAAATTLLLGVASACYPPAQARRDLVPSWQPAAGQRHSGGRLRHDSFTLVGFRGSEATRRWPLLDSRTVSQRYEFSVNEGGVVVLDATCRLMRVLGAERDRSDLACSLLSRADGSSWRLDLSGEGGRSGELSGPDGHYAVTPDPEPTPDRGNPAMVYLLRDGDVLVATLTIRGRGAVWLAPHLERHQRAAVMGTVFALLLEHEVKAR